MSILLLIVYLIALGFGAWLVSIAPFIEAQFKAFIQWLLIAVAAVLVIIFLANILGVNLSNLK